MKKRSPLPAVIGGAAAVVLVSVGLIAALPGRSGHRTRAADASVASRTTHPSTPTTSSSPMSGPGAGGTGAAPTVAPGVAPAVAPGVAPTVPPGVAPAVAAPFTSDEVSAAIAAENAKPGTRDWALTKPADHKEIAGYASAVSVDVGGSVALYVSTKDPTWGIQAFRMGWYGGTEGRLVWSVPAPQSGVDQPRCPFDAALRMTACDWAPSLTVSTAGWPAGDYLMKLQSSTGWQSYIPLTVRDDASHAAYLINNSVTTWEAYNTWGGYDVYQGPSGSLASRAYGVSFDRPYVLGTGGGDFLGLELPMISTMEARGLDVSYTTDVDLAANPALVERHKAFISLGHDEYYSLAMFQGLEAARDAGVNLIFLGANAVYRHIRLQPSKVGANRVEIDYKDATLDPLKDPGDVTAWSWRSPPTNRPESALLGGMWECNPVKADMVVTDPTAWVYAGTGLAPGVHIPNVVGPEYDHYSPSQPNPGDVEVLARSPVNCNGRVSTADMTYYSAASGAGVWDTGTIDWVGQVAAVCATCAPTTAATAVTDNVLAAFGAGPAGRVHPSRPN